MTRVQVDFNDVIFGGTARRDDIEGDYSIGTVVTCYDPDDDPRPLEIEGTVYAYTTYIALIRLSR